MNAQGGDSWASLRSGWSAFLSRVGCRRNKSGQLQCVVWQCVVWHVRQRRWSVVVVGGAYFLEHCPFATGVAIVRLVTAADTLCDANRSYDVCDAPLRRRDGGSGRAGKLRGSRNAIAAQATARKKTTLSVFHLSQRPLRAHAEAEFILLWGAYEEDRISVFSITLPTSCMHLWTSKVRRGGRGRRASWCWCWCWWLSYMGPRNRPSPPTSAQSGDRRDEKQIKLPS